MAKAISLISGGLDSFLATKLILEQGIEVEGIYFSSIFYSIKNDASYISKLITQELRIPLEVLDISLELLDIVKKPKYGYGKNLNPCIDCRILMFKKAHQYMRERGADFLITGEVLGERPFSQRREVLNLIDKEANLEGLVLRPLSARLLKPTRVETASIVDRAKLLSIEGKSRKPQLKLAGSLGVKNYLTPAGGCLLTDRGFSQRMKDLFRYTPEFTLRDVGLLKVGRHFRLSSRAKLIIARDEKECQLIESLAQTNDFLFHPQEEKGPLGLGRGEFRREDISLACEILASYTKGISAPLKIVFRKYPSQEFSLCTVFSVNPSRLEEVRI